MRFEKYIIEADNTPDTTGDRLKLKIQKLQKELADQNEKMGYVNAKKEQADEKEINRLDQRLARMAQTADRLKEEIARLKGKQ
jgi:division protein CdvB (Snf7/Vps24/ESCRT-III family)